MRNLILKFYNKKNKILKCPIYQLLDFIKALFEVFLYDFLFLPAAIVFHLFNTIASNVA